jgi:hypothetical protein
MIFGLMDELYGSVGLCGVIMVAIIGPGGGILE